MARKRRKAGRVATTRARVSDDELLARLEEKAPELLSARMPEAVFDAAITGLLQESRSDEEAPHFYCRKCGEYHLKTHPHHT